MDNNGTQRSLADIAEGIVDRFVRDEGPADLLTLEADIRLELYRAYYAGLCYGKRLVTLLQLPHP